MSLSSSLSDSFIANHYAAAGALGDLAGGAKFVPFKNIDFNAPLPMDFSEFYSGKFDLSGSINTASWTFITAPADISWTTNNAATRVDMFGTNNPPVVSGTKGMRDLRLGNALVEGFGRNVSVQGKVSALENLLNYKLNPTAGFVNVPVYRVKVSKRLYGDDGYFIFKSLTVKETMRDLQGNTTRAYVDIEMMQVPKFQVDSGTDQASAAVSGVKKGAVAAPEATKAAGGAANTATTAASTAANTAGSASTRVAGAAAQAAKAPPQLSQGLGTTKALAGASVPFPQTGVKPGSLYDASRWTTPIAAGSLYDPGRFVPLNQKLFP
jgi:hypothetical protein